MGDNFDSVAGDMIRAFVERIERLEEERRVLGDDIGEVYAEAKGNGLNKKTIRKIVAIRRQDPNERMEQDALLEMYMRAMGMASSGNSGDDEDDEVGTPVATRAPAPAQTRAPAPASAAAIDDAAYDHADYERLYANAVALVRAEGKASASLLQRRCAIGYNKASRLIERMEAEGIVSAPGETGVREVTAADGVVTGAEEIGTKAPASKALEAVTAAKEIGQSQAAMPAQTVPAAMPVGCAPELASVESSATVLKQEPSAEAGRDGGAGELGGEEGSQSPLPSDRVENTSDGPTVITAAHHSEPVTIPPATPPAEVTEAAGRDSRADARAVPAAADRSKPHPDCQDPEDCGVEASWNHMCGSCLRKIAQRNSRAAA